MLQYAEHAHNEDMGGIEDLVDLDTGFADDDDYEVHICALWHDVMPLGCSCGSKSMPSSF